MMESPRSTLEGKLYQDLEEKTQALYVAGLMTDRLKVNIGHLEGENEELKALLKEAEEGKLRNRSQSSDSMNRQKISDLIQEADGAHSSEKSAREEVTKLEFRVKKLTELVTFSTAANASQSFSLDTEKEMSELRDQLANLETVKDSVEARLMETSKELQQEKKKQFELERDVAEKDEEIECLESQFSSQCSINEHLREENQELHSQLESETAESSTKNRGNSLFSEVDDRRVAAEKKLVKVQRRLSEMEEKLTKEQRENKRFKHQIVLLRQTSGKSYSERDIRDLQDKLEESKRTVLHLTESSQRAQATTTNVVQYKPPSIEGYTDGEKQFVNFLQSIIDQKVKEVNKANREVEEEHAKVIRTELNLTLVEHEIMSLTHQRDQLKDANVQLSMDLQELQRKLEPENDSLTGKDKLPVFDRKLSSGSSPTMRSPFRTRTDIENYTSGSDKPQTAHLKVNNLSDPFQAVSHILGGGAKVPHMASTKSVRIADEVGVITAEGAKVTTQLAEDGGKERKLKRKPGTSNTAKFKSFNSSKVTYDEQVDCKQQ